MNRKFLIEVATTARMTEAQIAKMSLKEMALQVILPKIAGDISRWCITDAYMQLVANYCKELVDEDQQVASNLLEVALQRLSCGAVNHEPTPWPEPLEKEYWKYSSNSDEAHVLTSGCFYFLMTAMETCLQLEMTRDHAQKILFGVAHDLNPNETSWGMMSVSDRVLPHKANLLYTTATELLEANCSFDDLFEHYATSHQWRKHKAWFNQNQAQLDWKVFFNRIGLSNRWPWSDFRAKRAIKQMIAES